MKPIARDSLKAKLSRLVAPNYGYCGYCGMPWNRVEGHITDYDEMRGCFPLCEKCWAKLTIEDRLPHYENLYVNWVAQAPDLVDEYAKDWAKIKAAVGAGR